jgi:hypothetical protein
LSGQRVALVPRWRDWPRFGLELGRWFVAERRVQAPAIVSCFASATIDAYALTPGGPRLYARGGVSRTTQAARLTRGQNNSLDADYQAVRRQNACGAQIG